MILLTLVFAATLARAEPTLAQHPGAQVPLELPFVDESGRPASLGALAGGKPTVLVLAYYSCPGLCAIVLNRLAETLLTLPLKLERDFRVLTISIDPADTPAQAAEKRALYLARSGSTARPAGWRFLTGTEPAIRALAASVGFRYSYSTGGQLEHPGAILVLTADGRISRYLPGTWYPTDELNRALVVAGEGRIGTPLERFLVYCSAGELIGGRFGEPVRWALRLGAIAMLLAMGGAWLGPGRRRGLQRSGFGA
jgi:protein SCO1/2